MPQGARLTEAAYQGAALKVDRDFYSQIGEDIQSREVVDEFTIPIRSGQAWEIPAGHVCRITTVLNVFQCTGLNDNDEYFMKTCPAKPGDYFEFFAEQDLLAALSTCPGGDLSAPMFGEDNEDPVENCHPLHVIGYRLAEHLLGEWTEPASPNYRGGHGL